MPHTVIVIPCYNEARRLDVPAFERFAGMHPDISFLFSDDGSTDDTPGILDRLHQQNPQHFRGHRLASNAGKAEAVRQGILAAGASNPKPDYIGFWDADLATPLDAIPEFINILESNSRLAMVFGSRVKLLGRSIERQPLRHYLGRVFATAADAILRLGIYDTQCGAKLFRAGDHFFELLREPFISKWIFDVEIIAREIQARRGTDLPPVSEIIYEHPLMVWRDVAGSKIKMKDFITVGLDLFRIWRKYRL